MVNDILFLLVIVVVVLQNTSGHSHGDGSSRYCAVFDSASSEIDGYFGIEILNNTAYYSFHLNVSSFSGTCSLNSGVKYYLTTSWTSTTSNSLKGTTDCGTANIGGTYDPTFACSPNSAHATTCTALGRTSSTFDYTCSKRVMAHKNYQFCDVGDFSGKFGMIFPEAHDHNILSQQDLLVDFHPPYAANYMTQSGEIVPWISLVFTCGSSGERLFCGKFLSEHHIPVNSSCQFPSRFFPTGAPTGLTPYWQNVVDNDNNAAICLSVIAVACVALIYAYIAYEYRKEAAADATAARAREIEEVKAAAIASVTVNPLAVKA
mmetsp:Transcript_8365/g.8528  ORF Transcript_8365/g.8528 Transcript_8365/m.8528 type:complete len:319 (-) Transcript_8365:134-1090(-)|eukprot:CAMPEP_0182427310 /NCGR_PEP_ID=MMETSP1167-20130531/17015_1 /TAXON_ID=2988 /ORGANISM="Mallomonas Sp, Strain CCMP3275" /LENGTH=318 /DNA_ID=CAMNT_0024609449 /DNA_START=69 /DNA_END=1025 /DNA_ORIENTATION=-